MALLLDYARREVVLVPHGEAEPRVLRFADIARVEPGCVGEPGDERHYLRFCLRPPLAEQLAWFGLNVTQRNTVLENIAAVLRRCADEA